MDLKDKKSIDQNTNFFQSLKHAIDGIGFILKQERNFRFHTLMTILVVIAGWYFKLDHFEWIIILLMIGLVLSAEVVNTIAEKLVDLTIGHHYHPLAKQIKDMAAGLVCCVALFAAIIGMIIFEPHLWQLVKDLR